MYICKEVYMSALHSIEETLKDYLANAQSDSHNSANENRHKYNNLKIFFNFAKYPYPHMVVTLGISEVVFSLNSKEKVLGGLGADERYVRRWLDRAHILDRLRTIYAESLKDVTNLSVEVSNVSA
jgi:hypothetical protein